MGKIVFVEILDRKNNIRERVRVDSFPATIGRGYTNSVILDDRLIDSRHLELSLDEEGGILIEDPGSVNGTFLSKSRDRISKIRIAPGGEAVLRAGQTLLRMRGDDYAVAPASSLPGVGLGKSGEYLENKWIAFLIFFASLGILILLAAQKITRESIWAELLGTFLGLVILFPIWAGFWSFLGRVLTHSFRFPTHLAIAGLAVVISSLISAAGEYAEFIFTAPLLSDIIETSGHAILLALLLYAHLSVVSELAWWKRLLPAALISAGLVGIVLLIGYTRSSDFSTALPYSSVMEPIGRPLVRTVPPRKFFGDLEKLQSKVNAMAAEKPKP
jgi:hypothetical protein